MARKSYVLGRSLSLLVAVSALPLSADAEFACSAEVSYRWVKGAAGRDGKLASGGEKAATPGAAGSVSEAGVVVRFASIERKGGDEAAAKQALAAEIGRQKIRASESCKRDHEGFGECVATKMSVKASLLNSLSFSARTELEKAVLDECREQQGSCVSVDSTEPQCKEVVVVEAAGAAADGKKGDAKKPEVKKK